VSNQNVEQIKYVVDATAMAVVGAAWVNWLPDLAALFTMIWVLIRIWETDTIRKWTKRSP
jgi:hypothetical protein